MEAKKLLQSKTFWLAVLQAVGGILVVVFTELDLVGYVGLAKSLVDIMLRLATEKSIEI